MRLMLATLAVLVISQVNARASDGQATGCFDLSVFIQESGAINAPDTELGRVGTLCNTEKNIVWGDDGFSKSGSNEIAVKNLKGKVIAKYNFSAAYKEIAGNSTFTIYAKNKDNLKEGSTENFDAIVFGMSNDHIKKGERAGEVVIFGRSLMLMQK